MTRVLSLARSTKKKSDFTLLSETINQYISRTLFCLKFWLRAGIYLLIYLFTYLFIFCLSPSSQISGNLFPVLQLEICEERFSFPAPESASLTGQDEYDCIIHSYLPSLQIKSNLVKLLKEFFRGDMVGTSLFISEQFRMNRYNLAQSDYLWRKDFSSE